jgi:hypothetical protein
MKVRELIEMLKSMDGDARVVISGYEGGVDDVNGCRFVTVALDVNTAWYYGKHETIDFDRENVLYESHEKEKSVLIN